MLFSIIIILFTNINLSLYNDASFEFLITLLQHPSNAQNTKIFKLHNINIKWLGICIPNYSIFLPAQFVFIADLMEQCYHTS